MIEFIIAEPELYYRAVRLWPTKSGDVLKQQANNLHLYKLKFQIQWIALTLEPDSKAYN